MSWKKKRERKKLKTLSSRLRKILSISSFLSFVPFSHSHTIAEQNELLIIDSVKRIFTNWISILCIHSGKAFGRLMKTIKREKKWEKLSSSLLVQSHMKEGICLWIEEKSPPLSLWSIKKFSCFPSTRTINFKKLFFSFCNKVCKNRIER